MDPARTAPPGAPPIPVTPDVLSTIAGVPVTPNMTSVVLGLIRGGSVAGLDPPHRLAQYLAQITHESGRFRYDTEVWGPTAAQKRYDTRTDLGNSPAADGDGFLYRGRTAIQITGRSNYGAFRDWCRLHIDPAAPDFVETPEAVNTDPWEGLAPVWYWAGHDLNRWADEGNIEMVTRRINGGLNGYADRLALYDRAALTLLGYAPDAVRRFQDDAGLTVDGISGPKTRAALHAGLRALAPAPVAQIPATTTEWTKPIPADLYDALAGHFGGLTKGA